MTNNNRIFLSGGGNETQSFPLDKFFFDALPHSSHFLYIPVALRGHKLYPGATNWMKNILTLHGRDDLTFDVIDDLSQSVSTSSYAALYIGGGNTWNLFKEISDSHFIDILLAFVAEGRLLYGGSAGAIILGKHIDTQDDERSDMESETLGLDLLGGYSVTCHHKDEHRQRYSAWAVEYRSAIICLPEETGLVFEHGNALCVGTKPATIFLADGSEMSVAPGEFIPKK